MLVSNKSFSTGYSALSVVCVCMLLLIDPVLATSTGQPVCQLPESSQGTEQQRYEQHHAAAEGLRQTAAARGMEWLATAGLLVRAREEADGGNWPAAQRLVYKACLQAEQALKQADREASAWKHRVVK